MVHESILGGFTQGELELGEWQVDCQPGLLEPARSQG